MNKEQVKRLPDVVQNVSKRKAESPRLVLDLQTAKRARIVTSKALQTLLSNKNNLADHIKVKYSHKANLHFHPPVVLLQQAEDEKKELESQSSKPPLPVEQKSTSGVVELLKSACPNYPSFKFKTISGSNLDLSYCVVFPFQIAHGVLERLESEIQYASEKESKVRLFGKWFGIPRRQVAYGDPGLTYTFSGRTVKALEWNSLTKDLLNIVNKISGQNFNFVLVNRYKDGNDHIGEHRDDEVDLDHSVPIASLSFGAARDFVFRHKDHRSKKATMSPVSVKLESGSLLLMNPPTNHYWYHSLPVRKKCVTPRINLTFRKLIVKR